MDFQNIYTSAIEKIYYWVHTFLIMLPNIIVAIVVVIIFFLLAKLVKKISTNILNKISAHKSTNNLLTSMFYLATILGGFFSALLILKLSEAVVSLLAGIGIIGLAIGFAFQDLAANFISGVAIAISEPYKIGDLIETNTHLGKVIEIKLRTTDLLTQQGQVIMIPNKEIFQTPLTNYSTTNERMIELKVGVSYGEDLEKVRRVAIEAMKDIPEQHETRPADMIFKEFGESSINGLARFWITFAHQSDYRIAISEAIIKLKKAFDENNIVIPFPIRTVDIVTKEGISLPDELKDLN